MDEVQLRDLDRKKLADYLWNRLRRVAPIDPPLSGRFADEPPERFLILSARQAEQPGFRTRLIEAIRDNLRRIVDLERSSDASIWTDPVTDEQVAGLAFLTASLEAGELLRPIYNVVCSWRLSGGATIGEFTSGQFHLLRTLALLQEDGSLARFWEELWQTGPRAAAGLVIFGWARAYPEDALERLGELVGLADQIDLPATLWSLIGRRGPGMFRLIEFCERLSPENRQTIRRALESAGADAGQLRDFDFKLSAKTPAKPGFQFPEGTTPVDPKAAKKRPVYRPLQTA